MSTNKSILQFFKPRQAVASATSSSQASSYKTPSSPAVHSGNVPAKNVTNTKTHQPSHSFIQSPILGQYTSTSLSPPPSSEASELFHTPPEQNDSPITGLSETPQLPQDEAAQLSSSPFRESPSPQKENPPKSSLSRDHVIQNSDDEGEDSDSSDLQDLSTLFGTKSSSIGLAPQKAPLTPKRFRSRNPFNFHSSPLTVQPKHKYDLKTLVRQREDDEALEISSKRIKAMLEPQPKNEGATSSSIKGAPNNRLLAHGDLLDSVMAEGMGGEVHRVKRALDRTEVAIPEMHWSFFDGQKGTTKRPENPFPTASVPKNWEKELLDADTRYHTFISGFAENMVEFGKVLPDELLIWMFDELCWEGSEPLRTSYLNVLIQSTNQVNHLLSPALVQRLFRNLGGSLTATSITERAHAIPRYSSLISNQEWPNLLTALKLLTDVADVIQQESRTFIISLILRMSIDRVVIENVDLLQTVQKAITRLCQETHDDEWEQACQDICKSLFSSTELPSLRWQLLESVSSTISRSHDLRRRLAICFFFNDIKYSSQQSYALLDLDSFISRLEESDFEVTPETDYRELSALVSLLDIAVDDGCFANLNLTNKAAEEKFNKNVDELSETVKDIMRFIGNPGASFLSKLDAKRNLELVEKRISETIRSKPKTRHRWFDGHSGRKVEDLNAEKQGMENFVSKMKKTISSNEDKG